MFYFSIIRKYTLMNAIYFQKSLPRLHVAPLKPSGHRQDIPVESDVQTPPFSQISAGHALGSETYLTRSSNNPMPPPLSTS